MTARQAKPAGATSGLTDKTRRASMSTPIIPEPEASCQEFAALLGHLHRGGGFSYWWTNPGKRSTWWPAGDPAPIPTDRANCYFGVHPTAHQRGEAHRARIQDVSAINCLFAEFDAKDFAGDKAAALAHVDALEPAPSVVVDSGGGYHAYWLLAEPFTLATDTKRERARMIQRRWVEWLGGDDGAKDLARVLRVPGTRNLKAEYGPDFPTVTVIRADFGRLYELDTLEGAPPPEERKAPTIPREVDRTDGRDAWAEAALADALAKLARATEGERNTMLNDVGAFPMGQIIGAGLLDRPEVERALYAVAMAIGLDKDPGCGPKGIEATIRSGIEAGMKKPRGPKDDGERRQRARPLGAMPALEETLEIAPHHLTDLGNARRLVARHGEDLRYCGAWNRWMVWDGIRWAIDETGEVQRRAKDTVASMYAEASRIPDEGGREAVGKHALKSESAHRLGAMVKLAQSELQIVARPSDFDCSPWLLNVLNGTLDLRTGELRPHRQGDFITKLAPVAYDPDAQCPLWDAFLARIMDKNEDLIRFLQRHSGYALTGDTSEQCAFFHYGTGANGKTTFSQTIATAMGDYALQTPVETLLVKRNAGIPNDLARLRGARLVTAAEAEEGQRLAESLVKQMTGGDKLAARFLHAEFFEFIPTFKVLLSTNHKPVIRGTDYAIWRRIRLVPFLVTIPEEEQDKDLGEKLLAELAGVLAWAVRGCLEWQREGLGTPQEVHHATETYKAEMDRLAGFLEECCIEQENTRVRGGVLYNAYTTWCKDNGERAMSRTRFGRRLAERGLDKVKDSYVYYLDIALLAEEEEGQIPL